MNGVFIYYIAWILLSYAARQPWLFVGVLVLLALRRYLPSPSAFLRLFGRARSLRSQVEVNRANVTARRDLAVIYLDARRAGAAVQLLREGLALAPDNAELLYLLGLALQRVGQHEAALTQLVRAVEIDSRVRYGLPYTVAGDALAALKRWEEALDAYERYLGFNSSDVSGYTRVAHARWRTGDRQGAREALHEGLRTYGLLPASMKRRQFTRYLAAQWARVNLLREPVAIGVALFAALLLALVVRFAYAPIVGWFVEPGRSSGGMLGLNVGFARCGSQSTGSFTGRYTAIDESVRAMAPRSARAATDPEAARLSEQVLNDTREQYSNFEIKHDRILSGGLLRQEFCLSRVLQSTPNHLLAEAVWHEDVGDPGDASMVVVRLLRANGVTIFQFKGADEPAQEPPFQIQLKPL